MGFKSIARPKPSKGLTITDKSEFVPNQSIGLHEILKRFTRGESLPLGMSITEGSDDIDNPLNVDLEKMAQADMVDKAEFKERLKDYQKKFEQQEHKKSQKKAYEEAEKAKAEEQKQITAKARKMAKENLAKRA